MAVDGRGGSGKSTFAARLAAAGDRVDVVHTDDFAHPGETGGLDFERLRQQVLATLRRDEAARYQRFDWDSQQLADWVDVSPGGLVVLEGVSSMRREFTVTWDLTVWVETPRDLCLARGLERDGAGARHLWDRWLAQEDEYIRRDEPHVQCRAGGVRRSRRRVQRPRGQFRCAEGPATGGALVAGSLWEADGQSTRGPRG